MATAADPALAAAQRLRRFRSERPELPVRATDRFAPGIGALGFEPVGELASLPETGLSPESWLLCRTDEATGGLWAALAAAIAEGGPGPRVLSAYDPGADPAPVSDLAAFAALPRVRVAAPADAASTVAAVEASDATDGPVYLRTRSGPVPPVSDGSFTFARAPELRAGSELTVIAAGPILSDARALAERMHSIGVELRLLDGASVKPIDAPAVLKAARETGAILTAEEHHVSWGLGSAVAALTAGSYPVPVRRIGYPDLPVPPAAGAPVSPAAGRYGLGLARLEEEAWELLRMRGKLH